MSSWILGISASHNGAACLLRDDELVVAVQEERLSQRKRDRIHGAEPSLALPYCFSYAGIEPEDLDPVVLCIQGSTRDKRHDILSHPLLGAALRQVPVKMIPHHYGHALSAFASSGCKEAAVSWWLTGWARPLTT
ncbi:MAG TPA: carbamoyltransferase N-terminal domain-containing protein [Pyrinomonadaceae bacterium]|jgi:carbamoyltransferase